MEGQTDRHGRLRDGGTNRQVEGGVEVQTKGWRNRQTDRQTDRVRDEVQTYIQREVRYRLQIMPHCSF